MSSSVSVSYALGSIMSNAGGDSHVQDLLDFTAVRGQKDATKYLHFIWTMSLPYVKRNASQYLQIKFSVWHQKKVLKWCIICIYKEGRIRLIMN